MDRQITTRHGRPILILGAAELVTLERWNAVSEHLDSDPRIATCSLVGHSEPASGIRHGTSPTGPVVLVALDTAHLVGEAPAPEADATEWSTWFDAARDRGLRHDHWWTGHVDVLAAEPWILTADVDDADRASAVHWEGERRVSSRPMVICVDATWLGPFETGAQVLATHAIDALAGHPHVGELHLVGLTELPAYAAHLYGHTKVHLGPPELRADIVWFPNQVDARVDIESSRRWGRRAVCTYLDLIAYDIPRYHAGDRAWSDYRTLQRHVALAMDGITTISTDVAERLLAEVPALDPRRVRPIPLGLDHIDPNLESSEADVREIPERLELRPFILVLGNDFTHKNRDFAIRTWQRVLDSGHPCDLVLAGLHVRGSSSRDAEKAILDRHTDLRGRVITLEHVSGSTKTWLLRNAAAVHYPTSAEGFGFVPYEAAALGTPVTFTSFGPLREIANIAQAPGSWDIESHATDLSRLLSDPEFARQRVEALRLPAERLTWRAYSEHLVDFFNHVLSLPPAPAGLVPSTVSSGPAAAVVSGSRRALARVKRVTARARRNRA